MSQAGRPREEAPLDPFMRPERRALRQGRLPARHRISRRPARRQEAGGRVSKEKLRTHRTDADNLVSNLRGEVGDIVTTWVLYRILRVQIARQSSGDLEKDFSDQNLSALRMIADKLRDALIAQLSELAQEKIGRLNFCFAATKLKALESETEQFSYYIDRRRFIEKRNYAISHKELPETWSEHKYIHIPEAHLVRAIVMALRLIKKIDRLRIGPAARHLWYEMRKRRYELRLPGRVAYMLLPHLNLAPEVRERTIREEEQAGKQVWTEMPTMVNGRRATIRVAKEWGAIDISSIRYRDENLEGGGATP